MAPLKSRGAWSGRPSDAAVLPRWPSSDFRCGRSMVSCDSGLSPLLCTASASSNRRVLSKDTCTYRPHHRKCPQAAWDLSSRIRCTCSVGICSAESRRSSGVSGDGARHTLPEYKYRWLHQVQLRTCPRCATDIEVDVRLDRPGVREMRSQGPHGKESFPRHRKMPLICISASLSKTKFCCARPWY